MHWTAREFVKTCLKQNEDFGIDGYSLSRTITPFDKPLAARIRPGKKKTYLDDEIRIKRHVPPANYNVAIDWTRDVKSNFSRDMRHTIPTDIERKAKKDTKPEPTTYSPRHLLAE